jgi:hypothetical protein
MRHIHLRIQAVAVLVLGAVALLTPRQASASASTLENYVCYWFDECPSLQEGDTICQSHFGPWSWMELNGCITDGCSTGVYKLLCRDD